eukprot:gene30923-40247_t
MNEVIETILRHDQPRIDTSSHNVKDQTLDRLSLLNNIIRSKTDVILTAAESIVENTTTGLLQSISVLSPNENTLAVAILLSLQSAVPIHMSCLDSFLSVVHDFYYNAEKESFMAAAREVECVNLKLVKAGHNSNKPRRIINILSQAVLLMAPRPNCLTPAHSHLLQVCVAGQMFSYGISFIRKSDILEIEPKATKLSTQDYLSYFYYSGLCFIAVKDFPSALQAFLQAICAPASNLSQIVISAIKKARLISLIHDGQPFHIPKHTSVPVTRFFGKESPGYDEIVKTFQSNDIPALNAYVQSSKFADSLVLHRLKALTKIYSVISLSEIATKLRIGATLNANANATDEIERKIVSLVRKGEIFAKIDHVSGVVQFAQEDSSVVADDAVIRQRLQGAMQDIFDLTDKLRNMQKNAVTSATYILKTSSISSSSSSLLHAI